MTHLGPPEHKVEVTHPGRKRYRDTCPTNMTFSLPWEFEVEITLSYKQYQYHLSLDSWSLQWFTSVSYYSTRISLLKLLLRGSMTASIDGTSIPLSVSFQVASLQMLLFLESPANLTSLKHFFSHCCFSMFSGISSLFFFWNRFFFFLNSAVSQSSIVLIHILFNTPSSLFIFSPIILHTIRL